MGAPDAALGVYMNDSARIRSVLEYYLGRKLPEDWEYRELRGLYSTRGSGGKLTHRQRDFIGEARAWGKHFLLGLENQEKINLTFPWRLMELDCLTYRQELEKISERNRQAGEYGGEEDDFLYYIGSADRVRPILNLTLYWGKKKWERPLSLREMTEDISELPEELQQLAGDYKVHIVAMREIPEEALQKMDSDLRYVLGLMKRTRSSRSYSAYIRENRAFFSRIPRSALDVIDACTNLKDIRKYLRFVREEGKDEEETDMCYALDQIQRNAKRKGIKEGISQGLEQGIEQGIEQGRQQMGRLFQLLLADGRQGDFSRAVTDKVFQRRLLQEYHI